MISHPLDIFNPWWNDPDGFIQGSGIRNLLNSKVYWKNPLLESLPSSERPFHIIRGPRQVGKTTFLKLFIRQTLINKRFKPSQICFLSCESLMDFQELIATIEPWLLKVKGGSNLLCLDEISFVPEWQRAILYFDNAGLLVNTTLFVTGSNARDLSESSEKFPGRRHGGKDISFYPLSPFEMHSLPAFHNHSFDQVRQIYEQIGGFPHAISSYILNGHVSVEVFETYKNWVVGDAARYKLHEETLKHILYRIFLCLSSRITWPQLIDDTPIKSHETALSYVEHLQDSFICHILHCYHPKQEGPDFSKARKLYFVDPLLYYVAKGWKLGFFDLQHQIPSMIEDRKFHGGLFESYVTTLWARQQKVYFWYSSKEKKEVDLVLPGKDPTLYDCKLKNSAPYKAMNQRQVAILHPENWQSVFRPIVET